MATHRDILVDQPGVRSVLDRLKMEVAHEIAADPGTNDPGLVEYFQTGYGGNMKAKTAGAIGGHMVRHLIEIAEETIAQEQQERRRDAPVFSYPLLVGAYGTDRLQPDTFVH